MRVIDHRPSLHIAEVPSPTPKAGEVLIRVAYAGVNRPDILQRRGSYPPPADATPYMGLEVSGTIIGRRLCRRGGHRSRALLSHSPRLFNAAGRGSAGDLPDRLGQPD